MKIQAKFGPIDLAVCRQEALASWDRNEKGSEVRFLAGELLGVLDSLEAIFTIPYGAKLPGIQDGIDWVSVRDMEMGYRTALDLVQKYAKVVKE